MPSFRLTSHKKLVLIFIAGVSTSSVFAAENAVSRTDTSAKEFTIYAAGDIADCAKKPAEQTMAAETAKLIDEQLSKNKNAYAITLGDNTYPVGHPDEFNNCYEKTWGRFKARTLPSPGNHDYAVPNAYGYFNYFDALAGPDRRGYYKKTLGNWRLFSLNSNLTGKAMQDQVQWLENELKQSSSKCTLAFWHHPVFSTGGHGNSNIMKEIWKLLNKAKVDLVLAGHDHDYERITPLNADGARDENGIRSFVVGTGGAHLTPMFLPKETTEMRQNEAFGVLRIRLQSSSYEWEFMATGDKTFSDKGSSVCHTITP